VYIVLSQMKSPENKRRCSRRAPLPAALLANTAGTASCHLTDDREQNDRPQLIWKVNFCRERSIVSILGGFVAICTASRASAVVVDAFLSTMRRPQLFFAG
jgi:hypothetical protein